MQEYLIRSRCVSDSHIAIDGHAHDCTLYKGGWGSPLITGAQGCPLLDAPQNGNISYPLNDTDLAVYSCEPGYELSNTEHRVCQSGQWSGEAPECLGRHKDTFLDSLPVNHDYVTVHSFMWFS